MKDQMGENNPNWKGDRMKTANIRKVELGLMGGAK